MAEIRPELQARFGDDPDALEWARGHVLAQIDWLKEAAALPQSSPGFVRIATWCAEFMRDTLIGNRLGYGAFDERFARERKDDGDFAALLERTRTAGKEALSRIGADVFIAHQEGRVTTAQFRDLDKARNERASVISREAEDG